MSKNNTKGNILNESTIRRFMKLAAIEPLAESYLDQFNEEEDELAPADELGAEAPADDLGAEAPVDDLGAEAPADDAAAGAAAAVPQEAVEEIVAAIASAVEEVTGTPVSSEPAEEEAPVDDLGAEAPVDDLGAEAPAPEEEAPIAESDDAEEAEEEEDVEEALIKRVATRVAERLAARAKKNK